MFKPMITVSVLALTALGWMQDRRRPVVSLGDGRMTLEWTPGKEAVVRITAEDEEKLESIEVFRPDGRKLIELDARNHLKSGLSSLEIELRETDLDQLFASYAEGSYEIRAGTIGGNLALGRARLSFDLLPAPVIMQPLPGELVRASHLTVFWSAVANAAGYELELEQGENDGLRVRLPPAQSSFRVPPGFLAPGTETSLDVVAIGANGNRTVAEVLFMTSP